MRKSGQSFNAKDIKSEEQLSDFLDNCGISSQSPKDIDWLLHWWKKEFEPNLPPLARHVVIVGEENFAPSLCVAIEKDRFTVYMFNERDYWFDKLGENERFTSADELQKYLKKLVDQYLIAWKSG